MIEFEDVRIAYKDKPVLDGVSLTIHDREFFVLIGSSGCGKTTLLKSINKLLPLRGGSLSIDGIPVEQIKVQDLPKKVGYVVQSGGLFPHLTVEENIALTMQIARFSKEAIRDRVGYLAGLLTLSLLVIAGWSLQSFARLGVPEWVVRLLLGSWVFYLAAFFLLYKWFQRRM